MPTMPERERDELAESVRLLRIAMDLGARAGGSANIVKVDAGSPVSWLALSIAIACALVIVVCVVLAVPAIRDQDAYRTIHERKLSDLSARIKELENEHTNHSGR